LVDLFNSYSGLRWRGDLIKEDEHTYSLILMAWASGKSLKIGVDDRRRPYDSVCKIVWVEAT